MARTDEIEPIIEGADSPTHDTVERHPAYGQIGASRVTCGPAGAQLYGSDFRHQHFVTIRISRSELHRGLSNDWPFAHDEIIEVALSEAQWAAFVSTLNSGQGVQCTLQHVERKNVPQIKRRTDRRTQFRAEMSERLKLALDAMKGLARKIGDLKISGAAKKNLLDDIRTAGEGLENSAGFIADQFDEHMEDTTEHAKIEINAYVENTLRRAGLEHLKQRPFEIGDDNTPKRPRIAK